MKFVLSISLLILAASIGLGQGNNYQESTKLSELVSLISALDEEHCEVPCGIYGDSLRVSLIKEHVKTVEKAMDQINALSKKASPNYNQIVRWVMNKESHAAEIQEIVAKYFLHQRVKMPKPELNKKDSKVAYDKYNGLLHSLHAIQVYSMKAKQGTDTNVIVNLEKAVNKFESLYFHGHEH
jgi:nickel superoxide dismutase